MTKRNFFLLFVVMGWFTHDARAQTTTNIGCVWVTGTETVGGLKSAPKLLCVPVFGLGAVGPAGPTGPQGPQGPPGPAGSGTTLTGVPCSAPATGVNVYADLGNGTCLPIKVVPAAGFIAANQRPTSGFFWNISVAGWPNDSWIAAHFNPAPETLNFVSGALRPKR